MIKFARKSGSVSIPSKLNENGGYDLYANFDEPYAKLKAHHTTLIPTGLYSSFENDYYIQMQNRGSNGSKGLIQACGVIDSSYRGEWFVAMTNTNDEDWFVAKKDFAEQHMKNEKNIYPYEKAVCQFVVLPVPKMEIKEVSLEEIQNEKSIRGSGKLGSSGK